jgi:hypothetical protein
MGNKVVTMPRRLNFWSALVFVYHDHVESIFYEGDPVSVFYPPIEKEEFVAHARYAGYVDPMQFGLEHDVLHHHVAELLGWERSHVVWWDANGQPDEPETKELRDYEEHIVMRLQRYINLGERDDYGVLEDLFGDKLPDIALEALCVMRPWIRL